MVESVSSPHYVGRSGATDGMRQTQRSSLGEYSNTAKVERASFFLMMVIKLTRPNTDSDVLSWQSTLRRKARMLSRNEELKSNDSG